MTGWLLAAALLAAPALSPPAPWAERDGEQVRVSIDLRAWFAAPDTPDATSLRERLTSGLTTRLRFWLELRDRDGALAGVALRRVRVRWHLWDERFTTVIEDDAGARTPTFKTADELIAGIAQFERWSVGPVPRSASVYRVEAVLELNPVTADQAVRMRRWLASPQTSASLDPLGGGLLGSFVRFFDNIKPGPVEDRRVHRGPWFRADRLPYVTREAPTP